MPRVNVPYLHTAALPPHQEAAVLFAAGRDAEARALLERLVDTAPTGQDVRLWSQLFALYRTAGDWHAFDALAGRFAQRFARPAPVWLGAEAPAHLPIGLQPGGDAYVPVSGALDARARTRLEDARARALRHAAIHLDLTRVDGVDAEGCAALSGLIRFLAANGNALLLTGTQALLERLRQAVEGDGSLTAHWSLLLDLYQLQGRREDFERAALECALATGAPAPQWEAVVMPLPPRSELREQRDEPRYQAGPEVIALTGADDDQLLGIDEFARDRQYVNIALDDVARLAPTPAKALVQLVNALANGRVVRLVRPNPLVEALLDTLDLDPRVQLIRAQSL
jgi:ABC-type transporter Mla MlaB component